MKQPKFNPETLNPENYTPEQVADLLREFANILSQRDGQYLPCLGPCNDFLISKGLDWKTLSSKPLIPTS